MIELLKTKQNIDIRNNDGDSLAMSAAMSGSNACFQVLIEAKVDLESSDSKGNNPLITAASNGFTSCVKSLIDAGVNLNAQNLLGRTALDRAILSGSFACAESLIRAKAFLDHLDNKGASALDHAIAKNNIYLVALLLDYGATIRDPRVLKRFLNVELIELLPNFCRGVCAEQHQDDPEKAKRFYEKAKRYPGSNRRLGLLAQKNKDFLPAAEYYKRAIRRGDELAAGCMIDLLKEVSSLEFEKSEKQINTVFHEGLSTLIFSKSSLTLSKDQWDFLASVALGQSHRFLSQSAAVEFSLFAANKAHQVKYQTVAEKKESKQTLQSTYNIFAQMRNPAIAEQQHKIARLITEYAVDDSFKIEHTKTVEKFIKMRP